MPIFYNVYANDGRGGAVTYAAPVATTAALTFTTAPLAPSSDTTFAVRAVDSTSGLEEANTEARVRIVLDVNGQDVSARPNAPAALAARATAGGGCRATWAYNVAGQRGMPTAFLVYLTPGPRPDYTTPVATVGFISGQAGYGCQLTGLVDGAVYSVAVRASNAAGTETNTSAVAAVTGDSTPPGNVDSLAGSATFASP